MRKSKYYKTVDDKILVRKSLHKDEYYHTNLLKPIIINPNDFTLIEIKNQEYSRLMNIYFKDIKDEWDYKPFPNHSKQTFRKLPNFKSVDEVYVKKSIIWHETNNHNQAIIVYHWGKIYYLIPMYGGFDKGYLLDINTQKFVRWTKAIHCAPILNVSLNKLI